MIQKYADREEAAKLLAERLITKKLNRKETLVVSIPRGGVVVGAKIAEILKVPHKVIVIKKIGAPHNSELAIGATASFGKPVYDRWLIAQLGVDSTFLKKETLKKKIEARSREKMLGVVQSDFEDKSVIVVDDGMATGQTAKAAGMIIRKLNPKSLVLAVPCTSKQALELNDEIYDEIVSPIVREDFRAVGEFYLDFSQIGDEQVIGILSGK